VFLQETKTKRGGKTYISYLVRESFRTANGPRGRTICNLTHLPKEVRDMVGQALKGETLIPAGRLELNNIHSSGGCVVLNQAAQRYGLHKLLEPLPERSRALVHAMVMGGLLFPPSVAPFFLDSRRVRLAMFCGLDPEQERFDLADLTAALKELDEAWPKVCALLPREEAVRAIVIFKKPQALWELEMLGLDSNGMPVPLPQRGENEELLQQIDRIWKSEKPLLMVDEKTGGTALTGHPYMMELSGESLNALREEMRSLASVRPGQTIEIQHRGDRYIVGRPGLADPQTQIRMGSVTELTSMAPDSAALLAVAASTASPPDFLAVRTNLPPAEFPAEKAMEWAARARTARAAFSTVQIIMGGAASVDGPLAWRNHGGLRFITHWLRAQLGGAWRVRGEHREVEEVLRDLQDIHHATVTIDGVTVRDVATLSSKAVGDLLTKLELWDLFRADDDGKKHGREHRPKTQAE
jgi:hypothetical protein